MKPLSSTLWFLLGLTLLEICEKMNIAMKAIDKYVPLVILKLSPLALDLTLWIIVFEKKYCSELIWGLTGNPALYAPCNSA